MDGPGGLGTSGGAPRLGALQIAQAPGGNACSLHGAGLTTLTEK